MGGMKIHDTFQDVIGQTSVKQTLSLYIEAFKRTGRLPAINITAAKGSGKSYIVRKFREGLYRADGTRQKMLEVNAASIKDVGQFFEQVYPAWINNSAFLFLDEIHNLPYKLQQIFLNILDVKDDPVRTVEYEDMSYVFDFRKISFCGATTDQQKLVEPLRDRLRDISLEDYEPADLYEIFEEKVEGYSIDYTLRDSVIAILRGNPRDAVVKALDLNTFVAAKQINHVDVNIWNEFCSIMGIHDCGINHAEKKIIKALASHLGQGLTLGNLACITGFERSAIQKEYETLLIRKGLMKIDVKRMLTPKGANVAKAMNFIS